jgi:hypothetical protein
MMLERLRTVTGAKDGDDREARSLNVLILKSLKIWQNALAQDRQDQRHQEQQRRNEKHTPGIKEIKS